VYVSQPPSFEVKGIEYKLCRLKKALYGLRQAPRPWNKRIDEFFIQLGFCRCSVEFGVYVKIENSANLLIVCLYIDDLLLTRSDQADIIKFKEKMKSAFEMTNLRTLTYFLGLKFVQRKDGIVCIKGNMLIRC